MPPRAEAHEYIAEPPRLNVSVDVDTLRYYQNFAPPNTVIADRIMTHTMVRLMELFDELALRATFFVIGETVAEHAAFWRSAAEAGHEVASHSHTHPQAFFQLSRADKRAELQRSKSAIEQHTGVGVAGFRAPAYNIDSETLGLLLEAGYRYDSSLHPWWYVSASKIVTRVLSRTYRSVPTSPMYRRHWRLPDVPFRWSLPQGELLEIPLTTTALGKPFFGTVHLSTSRRFFTSEVRWLARRASVILYELHPTEVIDAAVVEESRWVTNIPGVGRLRDPWEFLRFRLQALQRLGPSILLRDLDFREAKTIHPCP